jgi:hypothetical protein
VRLRWRWLVPALLAAVLISTGAGEQLLGWAGRLLRRLFPPRSGPAWRVAKLKDAIISVVFDLETDRWLEFDLPPQLAGIRILVNADLPLARRADFRTPLPEDVKWPFAVEYQLRDREGEVLARRVYHFQTRLSEFRDPKVDEVITGVFYLGRDLIPADGRTIAVSFGDCPRPVAQVRLRLAQVAPPLSGAVVRVYFQRDLPEHKLSFRWERLFKDRKDRLTRGNVYASELLTAQEKRNLMLQEWAPVAPAGIEGRDYRQRDLYVLKEIEGDQVRDQPPPFGLLTDRQRKAVIPIPETGAALRLEFEPIAPAPRSAPGPKPPIELYWIGKGISQRARFQVPWEGKRTMHRQSFPGGVLEVLAPQPVSVRAVLTRGKRADKRPRYGDKELTPELLYVNTYLLQGKEPVEFDLLSPTGAPLPLRVDLRQYLPFPWSEPRSGSIPAPKPLQVAYQLLDREGRPVREGRLAVDQPLSVYERLQFNRQDWLVSDPSSYFFAVPPGVVRLRFPPAAGRVFVAVYNRPPEMGKAVRAPEDYYRFNRDDLLQRSWFLFRADRHDFLVRDNRVPVLAAQSRPLPDDPNLLAGKYFWEDYLPQGTWAGRHLLVPRDPDAVFRTEALEVTFKELPLGRPTPHPIVVQPGRQQVPLTLIYQARQAGPLTLKVFAGGGLFYRVRVSGSRGEIMLPPFPLPRRGKVPVFRVTASRPVRVFLNYVNPGKKDGYLKRLAVAFDARGLSFDYDKVNPQDETLSLNLFRPLGTARRSVVRVRIEAPGATPVGPFSSWTFRERLYDLRPGEANASPVFGTESETVDQGQPFYLPVGSDLPPGRYRVHVELQEGPGGYLIFARTTPGPYERRDFFYEKATGR